MRARRGLVDLGQRPDAAQWAPPHCISRQITAESTIARDIRRSLEIAKPPQWEKDRLQACITELATVLDSLGPDWRVCPFGSARSHFLTRGSNLDIAVYTLSGEREGIPATAWHDVEHKVLPLLHRSKRLELREAVSYARIPVLKLRFDGDLDVDLSCHNTEALRNTQLLRAYAELDPVVPDLVMLVKHWAKGAGVCGPQQGHLTSYALALMVIYFLQVHPAFQMPCLPTCAFTGRSQMPRESHVRWVCAATVEDALRQFFEFFSFDFRWGTEVAAIRRGRRSRYDDGEHARLKGKDVYRLHVEDPFLLERNLNWVLGAAQERTLIESLREAATDMRQGIAPKGLFGHPPAPGPSIQVRLSYGLANTQGAPCVVKGVAPPYQLGVASENHSTSPGSEGSERNGECDSDEAFRGIVGGGSALAPDPLEVPLPARVSFGQRQ